MLNKTVMERLFIVTIFIIYACMSSATLNCQLSCPTSNSTGYKISDPEDCRRYYICLEDSMPSDSPLECEPNTYFVEGAQSCSDFPPESCKPCSHCHTRCLDSSTDLIMDPMDCHKFYVCLTDSMVEGDCESQYFDGTRCVDDSNVCCNPCLVYCPYGGIEVYDPYDCTMYYLCENEGIPGEDRHYKCPAEIPVFGRLVHRCVAGDASCYDGSTNSSINPCVI